MGSTGGRATIKRKNQIGVRAWHISGNRDALGSRYKKRGLIPGYCEICGYSFRVTRHRIKPGMEGGRYVLGNVIGLCPNHHVEADDGQIPRGILFDIVQTRLRRQYGRSV